MTIIQLIASAQSQRLAGISLALLAAASCASSEQAQQAERSVFAYGGAHLDVDAAAEAVLAANDFAMEVGPQFTTVKANRVDISSEPFSQGLPHEEGMGVGPADKTRNLLAGADVLSPLTLAQNSMANNGGWRQTEEGFVHSYSGMQCDKAHALVEKEEGGDEAKITVLPLQNIELYDASGQDTACHYYDQERTIIYSFYASNWPDITLEQHYGGALKNMVERYSVKEGAHLLVAELDKRDNSTIEPDFKGAAFLLEPNEEGVTVKTSLWLNKTGNWHVKTRATYPMQDGDGPTSFSASELIAAILHVLKVTEVDKHINQAQTISADG